MTGTKVAADETARSTPSMKVSLWIMPPPSIRAPLYDQIVKHADVYGGSHPFEPHITVVGGISCKSLDQLDEWRYILKQGLHGLGAVPCRFENQVRSMPNESGSGFKWNQSCLCVMEKSEEYMNLLETARKLLGLEDETRFKPPVCEPHYSFFYGETTPPPPHQVKIPPNFEATQVALWCTDPPSLEGVKVWRELARFDLC